MSVKLIFAAVTMALVAALAATTCVMPSKQAGDERGSQSATPSESAGVERGSQSATPSESAGVERGSQSATTVTWHITNKTDPMTDKTALVAVARVPSRVVGTYEIQLSLLEEALSLRYTLFDAAPLNIWFGTDGVPRKLVSWRFDKSPADQQALFQDQAFSNVFHGRAFGYGGYFVAKPFASAQSFVIQGLRDPDEYLTFSLGSSFEPMRQQLRKPIAAANAIENARVLDAAIVASAAQERQRREIEAADILARNSDAIARGLGATLEVTNFCCPEYLATMLDLISRNWRAKQQSTGTSGMRFSIQKDGRIADVTVERSSGHAALDDLSRRTLMLTMLPPLPDGYDQSVLTVYLSFPYGQ